MAAVTTNIAANSATFIGSARSRSFLRIDMTSRFCGLIEGVCRPLRRKCVVGKFFGIPCSERMHRKAHDYEKEVF